MAFGVVSVLFGAAFAYQVWSAGAGQTFMH
jgi:hypothetical protein